MGFRTLFLLSVFAIIGYLMYLDFTDLDKPTISTYQGLGLVMIIMTVGLILFDNWKTTSHKNTKVV